MSGSHSAYEALSVAGTAVGFTAATFGTADHAHLNVESGAVRYRFDGASPTATEGHELEVGDNYKVESPDEVQKIRFIRRDGVSLTIRATFGREG